MVDILPRPRGTPRPYYWHSPALES